MNHLRNKTVVYSIILGGCAVLTLLTSWVQTGSIFNREIIFYFFTVNINIFILLAYGKKYFLFINEKYPTKFLLIIVPALLLFWMGAFLIALITVTTVFIIWNFINGQATSYISDLLLDREVGMLLVQFLAMMFVGSITFFYVLWKQSYLREQKLKQENLAFQYETLRNQVNPHFLFNCLNTLSSLISTNTETAELFVNNLSSIYRYILENSKKNTTELETEIAFAKEFFLLHQIRNEDKLYLEIEKTDNKNFLIVPVSLQILLENAIKHNMATRANPLKIKIYFENSFIVVENNLQKKTIVPGQGSLKTGLNNLKERTRLIVGKNPVITETTDKFIVKLPLVKLNESINN